MIAFHNLEIIQTPDGSQTLQLPDQSIAFRSTQGACTESQYVFVDGSQLKTQTGPWKVLELGLGTGLNFAHTVKAYLDSPHAQPLIYHTVEQSPLPVFLFKQLSPTLAAVSPIAQGLLEQLFTQFENFPSSKSIVVGNEHGIQLHLHPTPWQETNLQNLKVHAYYHDPFAPKDNPQCWTTTCFQWAKGHLAANGKLVTYAAASHIRRAMSQAGLFVAKRKGACNKREMTIAACHPSGLSNYKLLANSKQPAIISVKL